jgi:hypothetical protein
MAKMFYTLTETAEKLGVKEADVKQLATTGKLQQFRDRDKLMFKRDQVDSLAAARKDDSSAGELGISSGAIPLDDTGLSTGEIPLGGKSGDQIDLALDDADLPGAKKGGKKNKSEDSRMATGISVFDAGEIEEADPHTQTIVKPVDDEEELALESVGSGSGLLDLTQESDDTSLGAELLDEIYPGGEGSDAKVQSPGGSSGAFEPAGLGSGSSGLEYAAGGGTVVVEAVEEEDPAGNGLAIGMLVVALTVIVVGLIVAISTATGSPSALTQKLAGPGGAEDKTALYYMGGAIFAALIFGVIGYFIGNGKKK